MAYKHLKMPSMSRVDPGSKAILELPVGPTYKTVDFTVTAAAGLDAGDIGRIDMLIDDQVVMTWKNLQRLMDINAFWGRPADSVAATLMQFTVHLERGEFDGLVYQRAPGIGTEDVRTLRFEIEIASGAPADIAMVAHAEYDTVRAPLGVFVRTRELPYSSDVAGRVEIDKLTRGPWYLAMHLFKADVNAVEIQANSVKVIDATKQALERAQKRARPVRRAPVTVSATHVDFILDGDMANALRTFGLEDFRLVADLGTSGAMDVVTETLDRLVGA